MQQTVLIEKPIEEAFDKFLSVIDYVKHVYGDYVVLGSWSAWLQGVDLDRTPGDVDLTVLIPQHEGMAIKDEASEEHKRGSMSSFDKAIEVDNTLADLVFLPNFESYHTVKKYGIEFKVNSIENIVEAKAHYLRTGYSMLRNRYHQTVGSYEVVENRERTEDSIKTNNFMSIQTKINLLKTIDSINKHDADIKILTKFDNLKKLKI